VNADGSTIRYYPTNNAGNWVPNLVGTPTMPHFGVGKLIGGNRFDQAQENALVDIKNFAAPPEFTPGNAGRNIMTGPASYYSQTSAKKNFKFGERWNLQVRWDFQNPFHNYGFKPADQSDRLQDPNCSKDHGGCGHR